MQDSEVPGGSGSPPYTAALSVLDSDMAQYVHDNTEDELTHFTFLNAYLEAHGAEPANLDRFKTLPSSKATGAQQIGRLTNLSENHATCLLNKVKRRRFGTLGTTRSAARCF